MFYKRLDTYGPPDIADHFLTEAKADQLTALASYFEQQAKRLRTAAAAIRRAERHSLKTIHNRRPEERAFLAYGARVALLIRRGMSARAALAAMKSRTGLQIDVLRAALGHWRRNRRHVRTNETS